MMPARCATATSTCRRCRHRTRVPGYVMTASMSAAQRVHVLHVAVKVSCSNYQLHDGASHGQCSGGHTQCQTVSTLSLGYAVTGTVSGYSSAMVLDYAEQVMTCSERAFQIMTFQATPHARTHAPNTCLRMRLRSKPSRLITFITSRRRRRMGALSWHLGSVAEQFHARSRTQLLRVLLRLRLRLPLAVC